MPTADHIHIRIASKIIATQFLNCSSNFINIIFKLNFIDLRPLINRLIKSVANQSCYLLLIADYFIAFLDCRK